MKEYATKINVRKANTNGLNDAENTKGKTQRVELFEQNGKVNLK